MAKEQEAANYVEYVNGRQRRILKVKRYITVALRKPYGLLLFYLYQRGHKGRQQEAYGSKQDPQGDVANPGLQITNATWSRLLLVLRGVLYVVFFDQKTLIPIIVLIHVQLIN